MTENIVDFRFRDGSRPDQIPQNPLFTVVIDSQNPYDENETFINGVPLAIFQDPANLEAYPATNPRVMSEAIAMALLETREAFFVEFSLPEKRDLDIHALALMTEIKVVMPTGGYMNLQRKVWEMCSNYFGEEGADRITSPYAALIKPESTPAQGHLRLIQ